MTRPAGHHLEEGIKKKKSGGILHTSHSIKKTYKFEVYDFDLLIIKIVKNFEKLIFIN